MQEGRVVAYASRQLRKHELNYPTHDLELAEYADRVVVYDDRTLEMYIKPSYIKEVYGPEASKMGPKPYVTVQYGSEESLEQFLEKAKAEGHFSGSIEYDKHEDYIGALIGSLLPIILLVVNSFNANKQGTIWRGFTPPFPHQKDRSGASKDAPFAVCLPLFSQVFSPVACAQIRPGKEPVKREDRLRELGRWA